MTTELTPSTVPRLSVAKRASNAHWLGWAVLLMLLVFNVAVRWRLAPTPLERDEGEYAYAGQLLLQGIPPYVHEYNMKFPGTYIGYAIIEAVFGQTIEGVHRGMAVVTSINIILLFVLARRMWGDAAAIPAVVFYTLMTMDAHALALSGHATHFVVLPALVGLLLLMPAERWRWRGSLDSSSHRGGINNRRAETQRGRGEEEDDFLRSTGVSPMPLDSRSNVWARCPCYGALFSRFLLCVWVALRFIFPSRTPDNFALGGGRCFAAGVCFGLAMLAKQPGAMFLVAGECWLLLDWCWPPRRYGFRQWLIKSVAMGLGGMIPFLATVLWLWKAGALHAFFFWTIDYASAYGSLVKPNAAFEMAKVAIAYVMVDSHWLWGIGAVGVAAAWFVGTAGGRRRAAQLTALALCAAVAVSAGFYFRPHYFILLMPAIALGVGAIQVVVTQLPRSFRWFGLVWLVVWIGAAAGYVITEWPIFAQLTPMQVCNMEYGGEVFTLMPGVSKYIKEHTSPHDTVTVLGSEPEVYFYSKRRSASGYIYTYPLMEPQPFALYMQHQMVRQIEHNKPTMILTISNWNSWGVLTHSHLWIFKWWAKYRASYEEVGSIVEGHPEITAKSPLWIPSPGKGIEVSLFRRRPGR